MYKNGFTYVHATGSVNTSNGQFKFPEKEIPNALFGAFWFESPGGIQFVLRQIDSTEKPIKSPALEDIFAANVGKKIKLTNYLSKESSVIEGTIYSVYPKSETEQEYNYNRSVAVIQTATGMMVLNQQMLLSIYHVEFENGSQLIPTKKMGEPKLVVQFKKQDKTQELGMVYLEHHESWSPAYRLVLESDKKAHLILSAEIRSGTLDIQNADLNLVVAAPNIYSAYMPSSLVGNVNWVPTPAGKYGYGDNRVSLANSSSESNDIAISDTKVEDYFIYKISNFNLQKNQTALVQIQEGEINTEQYFQSVLPEVNEYSAPYTDVYGELPKYDVFHMLKFKNNLKQPLTSAPVLIESKISGGGNLVMSQPILNTTVVGGDCYLNIAKSLDIPLTMKETEKSRISNAKIVENKTEVVQYDNITMESNMHMENQGEKEVVLKVSRMVFGNLLKCDVDWKITSTKPRYGSSNPGNMVEWEIKLKPGEKKDITYSYQYYLRVY